MEDDLRPRLSPVDKTAAERRALRGFGIGLAILFFLLEWRTRGGPPGVISFAWLGGLTAALAFSAPHLFRPLYSLWMPVVRALAWINLRVICAVLYYVVVTPYGLLLRLCGWRPLELTLREKDSYWEEKPPRDPAESSRRIF